MNPSPSSPLTELIRRLVGRKIDNGSMRLTDVALVQVTDNGPVRTENQDRVITVRWQMADDQPVCRVSVLADGMGGMAHGGRAAALALEAFVDACLFPGAANFDKMLIAAAHAANRAVYAELQGRGGAALVAVATIGTRTAVVHAGDARAYLVDTERTLHPLTTDDTIEAQLKDLGRAATVEADSQRQLVQFIGMGSDFEPHYRHIPEARRAILLTSDGMHAAPPDVVAFAVRSAKTLGEIAEHVLAVSRWAGSTDNATMTAQGTPEMNGSQGMPPPWIDIVTVAERVTLVSADLLFGDRRYVQQYAVTQQGAAARAVTDRAQSDQCQQFLPGDSRDLKRPRRSKKSPRKSRNKPSPILKVDTNPAQSSVVEGGDGIQGDQLNSPLAPLDRIKPDVQVPGGES